MDTKPIEENSSKDKETTTSHDKDSNNERLSKRLAYILRYGAEKEGLQVCEGGWVDILELCKVPLLKWYNLYELMKEIINSRSHRGMNRYEKKHVNSKVYVRARYGRRMERNPYHNGTQINRLLEICMQSICSHLDLYDLEDFPDEFLINSMIHKLRRQKKLNNKAFRSLLVPVIEHLDLGAVFLTEGTIKLVAKQCPALKVLILRDSGYILTDHYMEWLVKRLPLLESLNLSGCHHLTDRTIDALCRYGLKLQQINLSRVPSITQEGVLKLVTQCPKLHHLDIYDNKNLAELGKETLGEIASERGINVVLKGLESKTSEESQHVEMSLELAGGAKFW